MSNVEQRWVRTRESLSTLFERGTTNRNLGLDGLRGVAILLVVASHASAGRLPYGGMVGVTLFFVLSGYLITSILLREHDRNGRVSFKAFYARRALRLIPAVAFMLLLTPVYLWIVRAPELDWSLAPASLVTLFYLSDFVRAAGDHLVVYGHTWSLAVEEQFYLLWPAILVLGIVARLRRVQWFWVVLAIGIVLTVWRIIAGVTLPFERVSSPWTRTRLD